MSLNFYFHLKVRRWTKFGLIFFFCILIDARAAKPFEIYQSLMRAGQFEEAERVLKSYLEKNTDKEFEQRALAYFALGVVSQKSAKHEEAITYFDQALTFKNDLEDFVRIHRGKSLKALGKIKEAKAEFLRAEGLPEKSTGAFFEAEFELGEIAIDEKRWPSAVAHFGKLERRMRGDEKYPAILYNLVLAESSRGRKYKSCYWARKLYTRFPHHQLTREWSIDLQSVKVESKTLGCVANLDDQRTRIRNLQLQGLSERARDEIKILRARASESTMAHVDSLTASFYLSEGLPQDALQVLLPYYSKDSKDANFFILLARVAAQAGEFQMAVGAYQRAHTLTPKSKLGRTALFQAAFLSYQFQDYDGAGRKYEEFIKKYPRSGLSSDARWHLAWIRYLKGDYNGAYERFKALWQGQSKKRRTVANEKTLYWTAMSLIQLDRVPEALPILQQISKDQSFGYYSLASKARLKQLKDKSQIRQIASEKSEKSDNPDRVNPVLAEGVQEDTSKEESEGEDDEKTISELDGVEEDVATDEEPPPAIAEAPESPFQNAKMARRFKRANDLIKLGLNQWATWEFYEIERKTAQHKHLKTLISNYEAIEAFNRSSYISQIYFSRQRAQGGLRGEGRPLWQSAYPRAFERSVTSFSKSFGVQEEILWAIMRAESQFKTDVKSPVGALGLMQLMPYTAVQVARLLNFSGFNIPQLFEPGTNIRLGARYLQRLLTQFEQSIPLAAAGYNAGPHRVRSWIKSFGSELDMDEFIEHIPFLETRNYVKKVTHNYFIYRQLYNKNSKPDDLLAWLAQPVGITISGEVESRENWNPL